MTSPDDRTGGRVAARSTRRRGGGPAGLLRLLAVPATVLLVAGCLPSAATTQGQQITSVDTAFVAVALVVAAIVWGLSTFVILRYRRRGDALPDQTHGNIRIEAAWTILPLVTVLVLFGLTARALGTIDAREAGGMDITVTAFRWQWRVDYPASGVELTGTDANPLEVVLPIDTPIHVTLESLDVNHAFFVPEFLYKRDAIPGRPSTFDLRIVDPGVYPGQCAEFCGLGHAQMVFTVRAVDQATFEGWLASQQATSSPTAMASQP